jgi:hypothetical protein
MSKELNTASEKTAVLPILLCLGYTGVRSHTDRRWIDSNFTGGNEPTWVRKALMETDVRAIQSKQKGWGKTLKKHLTHNSEAASFWKNNAGMKNIT